MGLKAAVQALKKAEELKARVSRHNDLLNNSEVWSDQQQLQTVYHQVLVLDLEYALDKKVEQELWTLGFKNHIAALQLLSRDKKNPRRSECQALLSWCLEAASGFYLTLLQELCSAFELDLPFRRRGAVYGQIKPWPNSEQLTQPHKSSCLYICQYCLVHLGDIARYRSQRKQAESFYRHAILLSPSSGQPYNQLALLEASRGDKLATVFHYVRSISVKHPFPAAATNLSTTLSALIDNDDLLTEVHPKLSLTEFLSTFLRVHGLLHLATDLDQAELGVKSLNATITALVATQTFTAVKLIQMTAINLYALRHTVDSLSVSQLTSDEIRVKQLVLNLLAGAFSAYLLPIYTMTNDSTLIDYYALPAIKLTLDWIKTDPNVLKENIFTKRLQIWPSLCKLLNSLQDIVGEFDTKNHEKMPLPEDRDLQCFIPLVNAFKELDFASENLNQDVIFFNKLRVARLVNLGVWLSMQSVDNNVLITIKKMKNPTKIVFEPFNKQPDPTTELLEELKHFNIKETCDVQKEVQKTLVNKNSEKRGGILKPQGSLEKAREEREQALLLSNTENCDNIGNVPLINNITVVSSPRIDNNSKMKRNRQNVAMQALAKRVEENNKQVKFVTEPILKPKEKPSIKSHDISAIISPQENVVPKLNPPESISLLSPSIEPIRLPTDIQSTSGFQPQPQPNTIPLLPFPPNQQYSRSTINNVAFPVSYQNNSFHNIPTPPQLTNHNFPRQQPPSFNTTNTAPTTQNPPPTFNLPFDLNLTSNQTVGYQQPSQADQFSSWMHDDKLPMPPSTWWTNNQKSLPPPQFPPATPSQNDIFGPNYNFNMNSINNTNRTFMQDNPLKTTVNGGDFNGQFNTGIGTNAGVYNNNMSVWNSGLNIQANLQMLLNQSGQQMVSNQQGQQRTFGDVNDLSTLPRDNNTVSGRDVSSDNQSNSMPGYSLFNSNWAPNLTAHSTEKNRSPDRPPSLMRQQSLFSGPGPSPLERLLEQQKQLRGAKEDT